MIRQKVNQKTIDFAELRKINEDIVAWIQIPGIGVDYPVVQGEDNEYYLHHTFRRETNKARSIFFGLPESCRFYRAVCDYIWTQYERVFMRDKVHALEYKVICDWPEEMEWSSCCHRNHSGNSFLIKRDMLSAIKHYLR